MSWEDPFFRQIQDYARTSYKVEFPTAVINVSQQQAIFDRCRELSPALDLDTTALDARASGEAHFTDEEIIELTGLYAGEVYQIYGAKVVLDITEALDTDDQGANIVTLRLKPSAIGPIIMELCKSSYEVAAEGANFYAPHFKESSRIIDKELVAKLAETARKAMEEMGLEPVASLPDRVEEPAPLIHIQEFTQARWVEAMLILDMIDDLKYLGLTSTDDLVQT